MRTSFLFALAIGFLLSLTTPVHGQVNLVWSSEITADKINSWLISDGDSLVMYTRAYDDGDLYFSFFVLDNTGNFLQEIELDSLILQPDGSTVGTNIWYPVVESEIPGHFWINTKHDSLQTIKLINLDEQVLISHSIAHNSSNTLVSSPSAVIFTDRDENYIYLNYMTAFGPTVVDSFDIEKRQIQIYLEEEGSRYFVVTDEEDDLVRLCYTVDYEYVLEEFNSGFKVFDFTFDQQALLFGDFALFLHSDSTENLWVAGIEDTQSDHIDHLFRFDSDNELVWEVSTESSIQSMQEIGDGHLLLSFFDRVSIYDKEAGALVWTMEYEDAIGVFDVDVSNPNTFFVTTRKDSTVMLDKFSFAPSSTGELAHEDLVFHPNPTDGRLFFDETQGLGPEIKIFDMKGSLVDTGEIESFSYDVSGILRGLYVIQVSDGEVIYVQKFVKL